MEPLVPEQADPSTRIEHRGRLGRLDRPGRPSARPDPTRRDRTCDRLASSPLEGPGLDVPTPLRRASVAIRSSGSMPKTVQPLAKKSRLTIPVPAPTSSTRRAPSLRRSSTSWEGYVGRERSYRSASSPKEPAAAGPLVQHAAMMACSYPEIGRGNAVAEDGAGDPDRRPGGQHARHAPWPERGILSIDRVIEQARQAEQEGFTSLWFPGAVSGDPLVAMVEADERRSASSSARRAPSSNNVPAPPGLAGQSSRCRMVRHGARWAGARDRPLPRAGRGRLARALLRGTPDSTPRSTCG